MSVLDLEDVGVRLGDADVLHDVSCSLDARTIAVVGENGSGKSTLARLVGGLITATSGRIRVLGLDPARDASRLRRRVSVVFSNPDAQIIMPTVAEDVAFSLRAEKLPRAEKSRRVQAALERFGLAALADRSAHDLSGGQKQLLALCGAFVRQPELVIADEPTAYLDARNARRIADHLFTDADHRLLLVTHDLELARRCETVVHVQEGTILAVGAPDATIATYEEALRC
ncbi:energy-coupling factor ABC transporter ATP-binding protein [Brachybacterium tyrofermentans]|uniref:Energy-coupling factor ABC transporter ATP-binding protein n=1 Tax=Brachybacterium tyrofermentans TaxID=47848 RepID=A0ABW0FEN2_9MICO